MNAYKHLYLVRHGEAVSSNRLVKDYDRALAPKGISNNYKVAKQIAVNFNVPQLIVTSPAARAIHTALIFARTLGYQFEDICILKDLYEYMDEMQLGIIKNIDNCIESAMLVGHNPSMEYTSNFFLDKKIENFPTSGVVYMEFEADSWDKVVKLKPVAQFVNFFQE